MKKYSKTKVALSYAEALYNAALEKNAEDVVFADIIKFRNIIEKDDSIIKLLSSPLWKSADKKGAIVDIANKIQFNTITLNCMNIISENNRFGNLREILEQFEKTYYLKKNVAQVDIFSAIKLSDKQNEELKSNLEKVLNKRVVIKYTIKPEILGGLVIQCGSYMIDDSIKGKIEHLELLMKGYA